jgi:hypothetical protein
MFKVVIEAHNLKRDGPAKGIYMVKRAPDYLRAVVDKKVNMESEIKSVTVWRLIC